MLMAQQKLLLKPGECRVIRVNKDGLFELIYETIIERLEDYFDIVEISYMTYLVGWADTLESFYFGIYEDRYNIEPSPEQVISIVGCTTESLLRPNAYPRYKTLIQTDDNYIPHETATTKVEHLQKGECRFIHTTREALLEFAIDAVLENLAFHFDLDKRSRRRWKAWLDDELNYTFAVYNPKQNEEPDIDKVAALVGWTIASYFSCDRKYKAIALDDVM